jgi:hypothetical protein
LTSASEYPEHRLRVRTSEVLCLHAARSFIELLNEYGDQYPYISSLHFTNQLLGVLIVFKARRNFLEGTAMHLFVRLDSNPFHIAYIPIIT